MSIEGQGQGHFFTIYFQVLYVLCFTRPRYQVSVYRTIGPLVSKNILVILHKQVPFLSFQLNTCCFDVIYFNGKYFVLYEI